MSQLLSGSKLDDEQQTKLDTIITSGQNLLEIINNILDMSKIEAGSVELEFTTFNLHGFLDTTISPLMTLADEHSLSFECHKKDDTDLFIKTDRTRLRQILTNLLSNAIKFTLSGSITLSLEELSSEDPRCTALEYPFKDTPSKVFSFSVTDTGTGISEDQLETIFTPFTQEDNSITRKFGGTGLGLSIVKSLVEMLGGTISVTSTLNSGSCFNFILPCPLPSSEEINEVNTENSSLDILNCPSLNILVAEDNMVNAMIVKAFIEKFGHKAYLAQNGLQAINALKYEDIDLILMDVHMPKMDGLEATKKIRKGDFQPDIPIIGLTAEAFSDRHKHFRSLGMTDVLSKPFTEYQLKNAIMKCFNLIDQERLESKKEETTISLNKFSDVDSLTPFSNTLDTEENTSVDRSEVHNNVSIIINEEHPIGSEKELEEIRSQIGDEVLAELLGMAPETITTHMGNLQAALETQDSDAIYLAAHTIMGTAGSMFAPRLAAIAKEMEGLSKDNSAAVALFPALEKTGSETITWWKGKMD